MKKTCFIILATLTVLQVQAQKELSLDECRQMALDHNINLKIAKESVEAAHQMKQAAFTQFLPNFSANGSYMWSEKGISLLS